MSSLILVEGKSDKKFFEALINHLDQEIKVDSPVCSNDKCELMEGKDALKRKLKSIQRESRKQGIDKVGIILDANSVGVEHRKQEVQEKITEVFGENPTTIFSTYIVNIDGKGELESLQRAIKSQDSSYADCLESFQACLSEEKKLSQKDFDKMWVYGYEQRDCNWDNFNEIYDFDHALLNELKSFLGKL